jgi:hypothetical protein
MQDFPEGVDVTDNVERPGPARREKDQREKNRERRFGLGRRIRGDRRAMDTPASKERRSGQDRRRDRRLGSTQHVRLP